MQAQSSRLHAAFLMWVDNAADSASRMCAAAASLDAFTVRSRLRSWHDATLRVQRARRLIDACTNIVRISAMKRVLDRIRAYVLSCVRIGRTQLLAQSMCVPSDYAAFELAHDRFNNRFAAVSLSADTMLRSHHVRLLAAVFAALVSMR